jgi:hypothetical protein
MATWQARSYSPIRGVCQQVAQFNVMPGRTVVVPVVGVTNVMPVSPDVDTKKITQIIGNPDIIHFATAKGTGNVTLLASISPDTTANRNLIDWEGATEDPTNPLKATISRSAAAKNIVNIKYNGNVIKELRVWVVWANLTGSVQTPNTPPIPATYMGISVRIGTRVSADFNSTATIEPNTIITDTDRPDFSGANITAPPGGTNVSGDSLSGGANKKWDMSRRIRIRATIPNPPFNPPFLPDTSTNFPVNPVVGNDDAGVADETNNPYSNFGVITSVDSPTRPLTLGGGNIGDSYRSQLWFQEFARLEIEGTWTVISDPLLWRVDYMLQKQSVTEMLWNIDVNGDGDLLDVVTEADLGQDTNGDGDMNDNVGYWENNGSASANDNSGA